MWAKARCHKFAAGADGNKFTAWLCKSRSGELAWFSEAMLATRLIRVSGEQLKPKSVGRNRDKMAGKSELIPYGGEIPAPHTVPPGWAAWRNAAGDIVLTDESGRTRVIVLQGEER